MAGSGVGRGILGGITRAGAVALVVCATLFTAGVAFAFWSAGSIAGGSATSGAASVGAGLTPTAAVSGGSTVQVSWAASTLSTGTAVSGYVVRRYDSATLTSQTVLTGCSGTISALTCTESGIPNGSWRYTVTPVFAANWTGAESARSVPAVTENTPPVNSITLGSVTGTAVKVGSTIYYNPATAGSFTLVNAVTDGESGPASSSTAALAGSATGWTHSPGTVSAPAGGPYVSGAFSWTAGTSSSPDETITGRDVAGNATATTLQFVPDSTAPVGTISYTDGFQPSAAVTVTFAATDAGSGLASGAVVQRSSALYLGTIGASSGGATSGSGCGAFGSFATIGSVGPSSPLSDSTVQNSTCYRYRYVVSDVAGNTAILTSANTAIVDYAGAVNTTAGLVSQWRLGEASATGSAAAASGGSNTAAYVGAVTTGADGELPRDANTAASLTASSYVQAATTSGLPTGAAARSVELWFRTTSSAQQTLFDYGSATANGMFGLWIKPGGTAMTAWGYGSGNDRDFTMPYSVIDGNWHHVVETYNGTSITLYIDGVALPAQTATRTTVVNATGFTIGAVSTAGDANSGFSLLGSIDEVSLYSTALTGATVSAHYGLGKNLNADMNGPTGGSVAVATVGGTGSLYSTSTAVILTLAKGTDPSGIAASGLRLMRATAPLTSAGGTANGVCGTFSAFTVVAGGVDPGTTVVDTVSDQACYAWEYVVPDSLFNYMSYPSQLVKVDSSAPVAPPLVLTAGTGSFVSGTTVYYRTATAGGFTVTTGASDAASGIASVAYPSLGTGFTSPASSSLAGTYSFTTAATTSPGSRTLTVTNNAGLTSPAATFTTILDNTAPSGSTFSYPATSLAYPTTSFGLSFTTGTDSGSGLGTRELQRVSVGYSTLLDSCGTFGTSWSVVATNPASPYTDSTLVSGNCYKYRYVVTDNVGNQQVIDPGTILKVKALLL